jgi:hypothetical protein
MRFAGGEHRFRDAGALMPLQVEPGKMADRFDGVQTRRASSDFAVLGRFQSTTFMPTNLLSHKRQE